MQLGWEGVKLSLGDEVEGSMRAQTRLAGGSSSQAYPHVPSEVQGIVSTSEKTKDIAAVTKSFNRILHSTLLWHHLLLLRTQAFHLKLER